VNNFTDIRQWLFEEFSSRLAEVFEMMAGHIEIEQVSEMPPDASLRWHQPFTGIAGGVWIAAPEAAWTAAGRHVLRAAGGDESDAASLKSTYLETVSQALSGIAGAIGGHIGREVCCGSGEESSSFSAGAADAHWAVLHIYLGADAAAIAIGLEAELMNAIVATSQPDAAGITGPVHSRTFELLLDIELPVSVSFGRAQVPLKDLLKLTTGSIVELNRSLLEPVEIIVNNCVIARGEVVVVEGNFGVRVHQVVSRQERLRTLN